MDDQERQILFFRILLQLSKRVREAAKSEEIGFLAVNDTKQLINYRQAALWLKDKGVFSVSGLPYPDKSAPYVQWLNSVFKALSNVTERIVVAPSELPASIAETWQDWLPLHAVVAPIFLSGEKPAGYLLLAGDTQWEDRELAVFDELCAVYSHGLKALSSGRNFDFHLKAVFRNRRLTVAIIILMFSLLFFPVRLSVQAQAEVVPKDPFIVRSPLEGIIADFKIRPNEAVSEGQVIFTFDKTNLKTRMDVASQSYRVAAEEYRQTAQMAVEDEKARNSIASRRGKMQERATEFSYSRQLLDRIEVKSPRPGVAIFADQNDWIGKNVYVGERVITIADPSKVEILINLSVADAVQLETGADVTLYLTADLQRPRKGKLNYISYKPEIMASGASVYRLKADFADSENLPRVGLTGVAKIYGKKVSVAYYIFRRPLTAFRQWLGW